MLEQLEEKIEPLVEGKHALLDKTSYTVYDLKKESWKKLEGIDDATLAVAFVDGGQCEIFRSPAAELHRIRTAVVIISGNKMVSARQKEGFALATSKVENEKQRHIVEFFDSNLDCNLKIELDKQEHNAENDTGLSKAAGTARRLSEIAAAKWALHELPMIQDKILVLDGTLETFSDKELDELNSLIDLAAEKKTIIAALAKTCTLLTDSGEPLISAAARISTGKGYLLAAVGTSQHHESVVGIAKLNDSSKHLFRVESATESQLMKALSCLTSQSNDLTFPGYPYGLIMVDRFARISNADMDLTKQQIMATAGPKLRALMKQGMAMDAHSILDRM
jgi:hypothetical protein